VVLVLLQFFRVHQIGENVLKKQKRSIRRLMSRFLESSPDKGDTKVKCLKESGDNNI